MNIEDFDDYMFHTYDINRQYNLSLTNEEAQTIKATSVSNVSELLPDELYLTYIIYDGFDENLSTRSIIITFTDTVTGNVYRCYNIVGNDVVRYTLTVES